MNRTISSALLLSCMAVAQENKIANEPRPIDFAKIDRTPPKLPASDVRRLYGIYLFGDHGEKRVWAVLEHAAADERPTVLYFDLDGDGDLTAPRERFESKRPAPRINAQGAGIVVIADQGLPDVVFSIGDYRPPASDAMHKDFTITWTAKSGVRFKTLWRGQKISFGGYGPSRDAYAPFADKPQRAPVFVPGFDRPFEFERWIAEPLKRNGTVDFKVFVGNRGDRVGAFSAVDDEFLPAGEIAVATLFYRGADGKPRTAKFDVPLRC